MKFISKYRRYSITLQGQKFAFTPEEAAGVYTTSDQAEIALLREAAAFGRDYHQIEGSAGSTPKKATEYYGKEGGENSGSAGSTPKRATAERVTGETDAGSNSSVINKGTGETKPIIRGKKK
ncbi:MAG: hypothetical protein LC102_07060 [Ignavibacteriales bacterium]|jgi:hypothetical protein|nr:MAG: hypothetical protein F9K26_10795 [Ignavibacteriaceae bacterium]MBW7874069.1 hypothetical protein [Ignavibacteria bacterium]MCZ2143169.1 hypothetical protein [Ignavibacteriales bacterium]MBV6444049.1 hypothetical protein [Ignavibacteriaceae bacterium]MBZ0196100.1 hypothetical protein [Ignavibacteriaceae bacterium]